MIHVRVLGAVLLLFITATAHGLEAGAAKVRITAPRGVPLDGYADRLGRAAVGEHDPLWARCLYLHDGETAIFLVNVDLHAISRALRDAVVARAASLAPKEQIILTATYTHNGPGGMDDQLPLRWMSGRHHPDMLETTAEAILAAMTAALEQKRRATLGYGTGRQRVLSANVVQPEGPIDEQVGVIRVDDADGKAIAIAANFSATPALVPDQDRYRFSADFPGAYSREMEALTDPGCVALFLPGAAAGQVPADPENSTGWERVETVGRQLALSAKAVANDMTFHDVTLKVGYREVPLPPSQATAVLPESLILQTLEVNGLLVVFLPGVPDLDLGLDLRASALEAGFRAQFTVGLANDNLRHFISRPHYAATAHAAATQHFGPGIGSWLQDQALALAAGAAVPADAPRVSEASLETIANGTVLTLRGDAYARGYQRGAAFEPRIQESYDVRVATPVRTGAIRPSGGLWDLWPPVLEPSPLALPALAAAVRPMLQGLDAGLVDELEGFADAAEMPFDTAWLLQRAADLPGLFGGASRDPAVTSTMFAARGTRAAEGAIAAQQVDWRYPEAPVVTVVEPDQGHNFVHVGFDWQIGTFTGLNDAGVALCAEMGTLPGEPVPAGPPLPAVVRETLQFAATYDDAVARLSAATHLRGARVLVLGRGEEGWQGAVMTYTRTAAVRPLEEELLLGVDPAADDEDLDTLQRYRLAAERLATTAAIDADNVRLILAADDPGEAPPAREGERGARFRVIMIPGRLALQAAFPDASGAWGEFTEIRLKKARSNE